MSHTYFDNNRNLQINGDVNFITNAGSTPDNPSYLAVTQRVQATNAQVQAINQGFKILCDNTAPSARYGHGQSFKGPRCHPGTRVAVQDHIFKWFDDEDGQIAMWMHGPVGIGKSAIAQTVACLAAERDQLSCAFFFFRSDDTRNTAERLVATLAYEMTQQIPHTRDHICRTVASNPLIFSSPLEHQIQFALLRPARSTSESPPRRRLVVIDGLDECLDINTQQAIIRSFISALLSITADMIPHKILIASRPESHIASTFSAADISPHVKFLALDSWDIEDDIRTFLREKLTDIHQTHPLRRHLPDVWPDDTSFRCLLYRSVGSFAYASVAIRHLASHNNSPQSALRDLLSLQSTRVAAAFADLDALYRHILFSIEPEQRFILQKILCLYVYSWGNNPTIRSIAVALSEDRSVVELVLIRVSSLIKIDESSDCVEFHHTSFEEFLCDKTRSRDFYIFSPNVSSAVVATLSNLWLHPISDQRDYKWFFNLVQDHSTADVRTDMARQILHTLVETKLPTSFLYPLTPETLAQMPDGGNLCFDYVLEFCISLHRPCYWKRNLWDLADDVLFNQAFDVICAWLRSHLDIFFEGSPTVEDIINFLLEDRWLEAGVASYESPSFHIFRRLVKLEHMSLLSSCICRVYPDTELTDICHGIIEKYIALPVYLRRKNEYMILRNCVTLAQLYHMIIHRDMPTIPGVCHRLERVASAGQMSFSPVIGSQLTPKDYIFRSFYKDSCYINIENRLAIQRQQDEMKIDQYCYTIAGRTEAYIRRAHAENDFPYLSADVETIFKLSAKTPPFKHPEMYNNIEYMDC